MKFYNDKKRAIRRIPLSWNDNFEMVKEGNYLRGLTPCAQSELIEQGGKGETEGVQSALRISP